MIKPVFEGRLNVLLSELLNSIGIISKSEQLGKGRKDVLIYYQGFQIVLEGSYSKTDALFLFGCSSNHSTKGL